MSIESVEAQRIQIEQSLNLVVKSLGPIQIGNSNQFPFGWRNAGKGRTVWRIVEEAIIQNLKKSYQNNFSSIEAAESEVGPYDFSGSVLHDTEKFYVNIKSAARDSSNEKKDDISKAEKIKDFFEEDINRNLFIATVFLEFKSNMIVLATSTVVMPIMWISSIYVNPRNANLQSSYKDINSAQKRSNQEFLDELTKEIEVAKEKVPKEKEKKKNKP